MVVDAIDRQRIDVAASGPEHDQCAIFLGDFAFQAED